MTDRKKIIVIGTIIFLFLICLITDKPKIKNSTGNDKIDEAIKFVETYRYVKDFNVDTKYYKIIDDSDRTVIGISVIGNFNPDSSRDYVIRIGNDKPKWWKKNECYVDVIFNNTIGLFAYDVRRTSTGENGYEVRLE